MPLKDQESIGKAFTIETSQKTCHAICSIAFEDELWSGNAIL